MVPSAEEVAQAVRHLVEGREAGEEVRRAKATA
jgi:hypothetical protein